MQCQALRDINIQGKTFASTFPAQPVDALLTGIMTGGQAAVKSQKVSYRFDGANVIRLTLMHTTDNCTREPAFTFEKSGTINISTQRNPDTSNPGRTIDLKYVNLEVKINGDAGALIANAINLCSHNDWTAGATRSVEDKSADLNCYGANVTRNVANI